MADTDLIEGLVEQVERRFAELSEQIVDPAVIGDRSRYAEVGREYRRLEQAARLAAEWRRTRDDAAGAQVTKAGVNVDSESISQKDTDFSALVAKVGSSTKVVFTPFQLASQTQLLAQQLKSQGKKAIVFATDGSFDTSKYNAPGNYVSFFAADVTTHPGRQGDRRRVPQAVPGRHEPVRRSELRCGAALRTGRHEGLRGRQGHDHPCLAPLGARQARRSRSRSWARRWRSPPNGDVAGAAFHIFKIVGDKYVRHALLA